MKKVNFNSIDNLEIPDSWVDKAIVNAKAPKPVSIIKKQNILAFAASVVLVCAISVTLFFLTNKNATMPVAHIDATDFDVSINNYDTFDTFAQEETKQSHLPTEKEESETSSNVTENNSKDDKPAQHSTITPARKPSPTNKPTSDNKTQVTEKPAPSQHKKPESSQTPTVAEQTTSAETQKPTEPETEAPQKPSQPPGPTEAPVTEFPDLYEIYIGATIYKHLAPADGKVYCKVYDENGVLLGDPDLFSDEHIAELIFTSYYSVRYYPYRHPLINETGYYTFVFYNSNSEILKQKTSYLIHYDIKEE